MEYNFLLMFIVSLILVVGAFIYLFNRFIHTENQRRNFELRMKNSENVLPNKLQAYERMVLFLERIRPSSMIRRTPDAHNISDLEMLLIETVQVEFDHNLSQQIYIRPETWKVILAAKNATQIMIKNVFHSLESTATVQEAREALLNQAINQEESPSSTAILYLQKDIQGII